MMSSIFTFFLVPSLILYLYPISRKTFQTLYLWLQQFNTTATATTINNINIKYKYVLGCSARSPGAGRAIAQEPDRIS